ncbi:MAG: DUF6531 domain-containing protein [Anaerolineae bacterium]|nr:DUF6531 domain-containing protein [Anaerolineae bacterium]
MDDLEIPTSAGALNFNHTYVSSFREKFTSPLGYGWVHNQDIRLIFPQSNEPGYVLFKDPSGNLYRFWDTGIGRYIPYAGYTASLTKDSGTPITYTLKDQSQNVYTFDQNGKITSLVNPTGHAFTYTYDASGRLDRVSADGGTRFLEFHYDAQNRLESVNDHTPNHSVTFHYDPNTGDLDYVIDVLGQTWRYEYLNHLLTRVVDPDLKTVERNEYYPDGRAWK